MPKEKLEDKVARLEHRVARLEESLTEDGTAAPSRRMLTTEEAATFLGMSVDGLRGLVFKKLIPYYKPNGKNRYFDIDELVAWQRRNHFEPMGGGLEAEREKDN